QAKGIKVALDGAEAIEGRRAYRLNITLPSGTTRRLWVDAQTFLEIKYDRQDDARPGQAGTVLYYHDYRAIGPVRMPMKIEAQRQPGRRPIETMSIDEVTLNPELSDAHFERPEPPGRRDTAPQLRSALPAADRRFAS